MLLARATSVMCSAAMAALALSPPSTANTSARGSILASGRAAYSARAALTAASIYGENKVAPSGTLGKAASCRACSRTLCAMSSSA